VIKDGSKVEAFQVPAQDFGKLKPRGWGRPRANARFSCIIAGGGIRAPGWLDFECDAMCLAGDFLKDFGFVR